MKIDVAMLTRSNVPFSMADYRPDMEKRAEWPAPGRAAVSPFPGDILPSRRVVVQRARPCIFVTESENSQQKGEFYTMFRGFFRQYESNENLQVLRFIPSKEVEIKHLRSKSVSLRLQKDVGISCNLAATPLFDRSSNS